MREAFRCPIRCSTSIFVHFLRCSPTRFLPHGFSLVFLRLGGCCSPTPVPPLASAGSPAFSRINGVRAVSGFVDDWAAAMRGRNWNEVIGFLDSLLLVVEEFESASGSRINRSKSALVPSKRLTDEEVCACRVRWEDLRISYRERLLGLHIGLDATLDDQYLAPLAKFERLLGEFDAKTASFPLPVRIIVANVFLYSLVSFQNRHFMMPQGMVR